MFIDSGQPLGMKSATPTFSGNTSTKVFPSDLNAEYYGASKMSFKAYTLDGIGLGGGLGQGLSNMMSSQQDRDVTQGLGEQVRGATDSMINAGGDFLQAAMGEGGMVSGSGRLRPGDEWQLFLPENISVNTSAEWSQVSLNPIGEALNQLANNTGLTGIPLQAAKIANQEALNPWSELMFQRIGHRSFSFRFVLAPRTEQETHTVKDLVKFFRCNMTPEITENTMNLVLKYPNYFEIKILHKERQNPFFLKYTYCVLNSINVQYGMAGPILFRNGSPNAIAIDLNFTEIEPIYRKMICEGGY